MDGYLISCNLSTRHSYNLVADRYIDPFLDEIRKKGYNQRLLDLFAQRFPDGSLICDAGCGPSAHIGRYLFDKGMKVIGVDISDRCIAMASNLNKGIEFICDDIAQSDLITGSFDGIISYDSIIHTPKSHMNILFDAFYRILKPGGSLMVAVNAGLGEGFQKELLGINTEIYISCFSEAEIRNYFETAGFAIDLLEIKKSCNPMINNERIYAIGIKPPATSIFPAAR